MKIENYKAKAIIPILNGCLFLILISILISWFDYIATFLRNGHLEYTGANPILLPILGIVTIILITLAKKQFTLLPIFSLISILLFGALYTAIHWGADNPEALLIYALVIIITSLLVSSKSGFLITMFLVISHFSIIYLQSNNLIQIQNNWKSFPITFEDGVIFFSTLLIITTISFLSNREIEKALARARDSEKALIQERDLLEIRVEQRTHELQKAQAEKLEHLHRMANIGKIASGLIHELVNPLTAVLMSIDQIESSHLTNQHYSASIEKALERAKKGAKHMELYIEHTRMHLQNQTYQTTFSIEVEIEKTMHIFESILSDKHIKIRKELDSSAMVKGNPIFFRQVMSNLISNSIDSYDSPQEISEKRIVVTSHIKNNHIQISVADFGVGIPKEIIAEIFNPFFTTKLPDKGTGIGLSLTIDIVENHFGGTISVQSTPEKGTVFYCTLPLR